MSLHLTNNLITDFAPRIIAWQKQYGRHNLPWQNPRTPYRVWLSEIMLQQTQVTTVLPYYQYFINHWPTLESLANANPEAILTAWSGLGYYARARNLHACAQIIITKHHKQFPDQIPTLIQLPGIGRSTAGAIRTLAFQKPGAILDGNVKRILSRYFAIDWPTYTSEGTKKLWRLSEQLIPKQDIIAYTQGLMDLGATCCKRATPNCPICPLKDLCIAYQQNKSLAYPIPKPKKTKPNREQHWLIAFEQQKQVIGLIQQPSKGLWAQMWTPLLLSPKEFSSYINKYQIKQLPTQQPSIKHSFTHFNLSATPWLINKNIANRFDIQWHYYPIEHALKLALPAPVKKLLQNLMHG